MGGERAGRELQRGGGGVAAARSPLATSSPSSFIDGFGLIAGLGQQALASLRARGTYRQPWWSVERREGREKLVVVWKEKERKKKGKRKRLLEKSEKSELERKKLAFIFRLALGESPSKNERARAFSPAASVAPFSFLSLSLPRARVDSRPVPPSRREREQPRGVRRSEREREKKIRKHVRHRARLFSSLFLFFFSVALPRPHASSDHCCHQHKCL
jgi:hypothetical protein